MSAASRRVLALLCALSLLPVLAATPVAAATGNTIYVTTNADGPPSQDADCSLREAITAANTNTGAYGCPAGSAAGPDTIRFLDGFTVAINIDSVAKNFPYINSQMIIDGSMATVTIDINDVLDSGGLFTVLAGGNLTVKSVDVIDGDTFMYSVVSLGTLSIVDSFLTDNAVQPAIVNQGTTTLTDSWINKSRATHDGGGVYNTGTLNLVRSVLQDNDTTTSGGAIYNYSGTVNASQTAFDLNDATVAGGSIAIAAGTVNLSATSFARGTAGKGAAIASSGTLTIKDSGFGQSSATGDAGAIEVSAGTTTVERTTFGLFDAGGNGGGLAVRNGATAKLTDVDFDDVDAAGNGGSIYAEPLAPVTVTRGTFENGNAVDGAAIWSAGSASVISSTFTNNTATSDGGAIYISPTGSGSTKSSTFTGNSAVNGGAILVDDGSYLVVNSTFFDNSASGGAGAIGAFIEAVVSVIHSTITANTAAAGGGLAAGLDPITLKNTIVSGNFAGAGTENIATGDIAPTSVGNVTSIVPNLDDYLGPLLADNGGPTQTLRLINVAGNPFRNTANSTACTDPIVAGKDQRGGTRPTTGCDIGAFELDTTAPVISASPKPAVRSGVTMDSGRMRARVSWSVTDGTPSAGIKRFVVERSVNGGAWEMIADTITTRYLDVTLISGKTYRFRVRATDFDNNTSATVAGPTVTASLKQQSSSAVRYRGTWTSKTSSLFSGGSARYAKAKGASATFTFTGRSVAWITTKGPTRGKAKIYVDGTYIKTMDLLATSTTYRFQAYQKTFSKVGTHTLKVVVSGTSGRPRVDVDAFAVLK